MSSISSDFSFIEGSSKLDTCQGRRSSSLLSHRGEADAGTAVRRSSSSLNVAWVLPLVAQERSFSELCIISQCTGGPGSYAPTPALATLSESPLQKVTELIGVADDGAPNAALAKDGDAEPRAAAARSRAQFTDQPSATTNTSAVERTPKRKALLVGVHEIRDGTSPALEKPEELVCEATDVGCMPRGINPVKKRKKKDANSQTQEVIGAHRDVEAMRELLKSMIFASSFFSSSGYYSASTSLCREIWL